MVVGATTPQALISMFMTTAGLGVAALVHLGFGTTGAGEASVGEVLGAGTDGTTGAGVADGTIGDGVVSVWEALGGGTIGEWEDSTTGAGVAKVGDGTDMETEIMPSMQEEEDTTIGIPVPAIVQEPL